MSGVWKGKKYPRGRAKSALAGEGITVPVEETEDDDADEESYEESSSGASASVWLLWPELTLVVLRVVVGMKSSPPIWSSSSPSSSASLKPGRALSLALAHRFCRSLIWSLMSPELRVVTSFVLGLV